MLKQVELKAVTADQKEEPPIVGREYFRNPEVNSGFYSKKRMGVADVDPKVTAQPLTRSGHGTLPPDPRQTPTESRYRPSAQALRLS